MDLKLKGKTALVMGASRGIGRATAQMFADEGANVAICARGADGVADTVKALQGQGAKAWGQAVDIADPAQLKAFIEKAAETFGGLDIVISNASALITGAGEAEWKAMFETDMMGAVRAFDAAKPFLTKAGEKHGDAAFIMIGSVASAENSSPQAYGALKAALIHYAKGVAKANAKRHIRCNVVSPGTVFFEGGVWGKRKAEAPDVFEAVLKRNPTGRMATPEEIASAVVFLASPRSGFTTGISLVVDGALSERVNF